MVRMIKIKTKIKMTHLLVLCLTTHRLMTLERCSKRTPHNQTSLKSLSNIFSAVSKPTIQMSNMTIIVLFRIPKSLIYRNSKVVHKTQTKCSNMLSNSISNKKTSLTKSNNIMVLIRDWTQLPIPQATILQALETIVPPKYQSQMT